MEKENKEAEINKFEAFKKTGIRWSILKCLHEFLCATKKGVPFLNDLEVVRSMIETGFQKKQVSTRTIEEADILLDRVQIKLFVKTIPLRVFLTGKI